MTARNYNSARRKTYEQAVCQTCRRTFDVLPQYQWYCSRACHKIANDIAKRQAMPRP